MTDRSPQQPENRRKKERDRPPALPPELEKKVLELDRQGFGSRRIAKMLGLGRKQVRNTLGTSTAPITNTSRSKLEPYRDVIREKVKVGLTTSRILREIRREGYTGGRTILGEYVKELRGPLAPKKMVKRRFETGPAEEMQVDWSTYPVRLGGKLRVVHAFAAILAYSRSAFVRFFFNQRQATLLEAHVLAFAAFQGVTQRVVYDRMATVVLGTIGKGRKPLWHPRFSEFCRHYGFEPFLCKVKDPDRKGAVEAIIGYLERDFVRGSEFPSLDKMNRAVQAWLDDIANCRIHGTTRRVPEEAYLEEKPFLIALPQTLFPVFDEELRQVDKDATISVSGTRYTIPAHLAPGKVLVRLYAEHFEVVDAHGVVAMTRIYVPEAEKGRLVIDPAHYESVRPRGGSRRGSTAYLEERLLERFPQLAELLAGIKLRMKSLSHVPLRELWRMSEQWGEPLFLQAALRAQQFRRFDANAIKRILELEHPLPEDDPIAPLGAEARLLCELGDVDGGSLDDYAHLDGDGDDPDDDSDADGTCASLPK